MLTLLNITMHDGSRQFLSLPESYPWEPFRDHLAKLPGIVIKDFLSDRVTEVWIDFSYEEHLFTINNQIGEFWFFVSDPNCPDVTLDKIAAHADKFYKK